MTSNKKTILILSALNLLLIFTVGVLLLSPKTDPANDESIRYTLYIGLNDKDTYAQEISTEEARKIVDEICCEHVGGFTVFRAEGGWTDESSVMTRENTLVYMFSGAEEAQITAIMDEVLTALNQSVILVHKDTVQSSYYAGAE